MLPTVLSSFEVEDSINKREHPETDFHGAQVSSTMYGDSVTPCLSNVGVSSSTGAFEQGNNNMGLGTVPQGMTHAGMGYDSVTTEQTATLSNCMFSDASALLPIEMENQMILTNITEEDIQHLGEYASNLEVPVLPSSLPLTSLPLAATGNDNYADLSTDSPKSLEIDLASETTNASDSSFSHEESSCKKGLRNKLMSKQKHTDRDERGEPVHSDRRRVKMEEQRLNTEQRLRPKFQDPSELDPGTRGVLLQRRERNKKAALKCREKKRKQVDFLVEEQKKFESENADLQYQIQKYQAELARLNKQWSDHNVICPLLQPKVKKEGP